VDIKGFIESSLIEWEGKVACVLFLPLCNLRCRYCHAGHLLDPKALESIPRDQVFSYIKRQGGWLDGVVITGGEPTLHEEALLELIAQIRALGPKVMVETNGTRPQWVERLLEGGHLDAIAMDVKAPLEAQAYRRVAGREVDVEALRRSIRAILSSGIPHEFRITLVPGLVGEREVAAIAPALEGAQTVALQNFQPEHCLDPALRRVLPYLPEEMDAMAALLQDGIARVLVRGRERGVAVRGRRAAEG